MLKLIAKKYNLPVGGKKDELIKRLYNYLKKSYYVLNIQKIGRGYLQRKYNKLHGPAFFNRSICTNEDDFYSLINLVKFLMANSLVLKTKMVLFMDLILLQFIMLF